MTDCGSTVVEYLVKNPHPCQRTEVAGADPEDAQAVAESFIPRLRSATMELAWLLDRNYSDVAALKLVGDRHLLTKRQRMVIRRCAIPAREVEARQGGRRASPVGLTIAVDGFNQLVTTERGLAGGAIIRGRDGVVRDIASVHGTWRRSDRTPAALDLLIEALDGAASVVWILDSPVSNSGRLAALIRERGPFEVRLEARADQALVETGGIVASSDGPVIERAPGWLPLAELALRNAGIEPVDLSFA